MQSTVVITIVGPDRPGLVESISRTVEAGEGNWTHSRMAHLGGQFAGMLLVETREDRVDALIAELENLQSGGLTVTAVRGASNLDTISTASSSNGDILEMELVGQDRPGIVRNISSTVAASGANIDDLATECFSAPMSGEKMFRATARVQLPDGLDATELQQELEAIAVDLMVDLKIAS